MWALASWWVLLVLPLPWFARRALNPEQLDSGAALTVPAGNPLATLVAANAGGGRRRSWPALVLWAVWALAVLAAARPQYVGEPVTLPVSGRDLLLAVDLSGSMEEQDFMLRGSWVDRLTATKAVSEEFIDNRTGDRVGLILFGREAYLQTPLTFDRKTVNALLQESAIGLAGKETAIGDAIGLAIRTLDDAGIEDGRRVLILMTDGANTAGEVDPLKAAELAAQRHMVIYTVGIGAEAMEVRTLFGARIVNPSADLDEATLQRIADLTGGQYFRATDTEALTDFYARIDELEPAESDQEGYRPVTELFYWPLGTAAVLALLAVLAGALPGVMVRPMGGSRG